MTSSLAVGYTIRWGLVQAEAHLVLVCAYLYLLCGLGFLIEGPA